MKSARERSPDERMSARLDVGSAIDCSQSTEQETDEEGGQRPRRLVVGQSFSLEKLNEARGDGQLGRDGETDHQADRPLANAESAVWGAWVPTGSAEV